MNFEDRVALNFGRLMLDIMKKDAEIDQLQRELAERQRATEANTPVQDSPE